jgi:hypothetical protein
MSEPENILARWSRLKQKAKAERAKAEPVAQAVPDHAEATPPSPVDETANASAERDPATSVFDPASLPPIESITATSDIRAFLQSGVPTELTRAALRRVWSADPAIRDFIGIAENQWDFNDPASIHGFGPIESSVDDLRKLVSQATGEISDAVASLDGPPQPEGTVALRAPTVSEPVQVSGIPDVIGDGGAAAEQSASDAATQQSGRPEERQVTGNRRGHGSALPQ